MKDVATSWQTLEGQCSGLGNPAYPPSLQGISSHHSEGNLFDHGHSHKHENGHGHSHDHESDHGHSHDHERGHGHSHSGAHFDNFDELSYVSSGHVHSPSVIHH